MKNARHPLLGAPAVLAALISLPALVAAPRPGTAATTNPEQLFASGYAACFSSALQHVARVQKLKTGPVTVQANVSIGPVGGVFGLDVELVVTVPELAKEQAEALVRAAHEVCPYSNATRGNIPVALRVG